MAWHTYIPPTTFSPTSSTLSSQLSAASFSNPNRSPERILRAPRSHLPRVSLSTSCLPVTRRIFCSISEIFCVFSCVFVTCYTWDMGKSSSKLKPSKRSQSLYFSSCFKNCFQVFCFSEVQNIWYVIHAPTL